MAGLSSIFLGLLVATLEFEVSAAIDCTQLGGVCIPFYQNVKCVTVAGDCFPGAICCKACNSIPTPSCNVNGGYCVRKTKNCRSGNIIPGCKGKKCKFCCMPVSPPQPSCQPYTGAYGTYGEVGVPENGLIPYQDDLNCQWIIEVPYGNWISVNFWSFDLEGSPSYCPWDYLQFSDGSSYPQWFGEKLCGSPEMIPTNFTANTNIIRVDFHSDVSVGKTGFYFSWSAIVTSSCQAYSAFYGDYGEVYMPDNGLPQYMDNQDCEWLIEVTPGFGISIYISSLDLEGPSYCPYDYLQFFDASGNYLWESQKLCGSYSEIPTYFYAPTNSILAVFHSDGSVVGNGFTFTWYAEAPTTTPPPGSCSPYAALYGDYGVVYMPDNGISPYMNYQDCEWLIEVPSGYGIYIEIQSFELEDPPHCPFDYLQFFDASGNNLWQSQKLCGDINAIQTNFYAPTNRILAVFHSDSSVVMNGFTFNWYAGVLGTPDPSTSSCAPQSDLYGSYGVVYMPDNGFPPFRNSEDCEWLIEVPPGFGIEINILDLDLEGPLYCPWDYLQFFDASGNSPWQSQKLCGITSEIQTYFWIPSNKILAVFHSDHMIVMRGFTFTWFAAGTSTNSPPMLTGQFAA